MEPLKEIKSSLNKTNNINKDHKVLFNIEKQLQMCWTKHVLFSLLASFLLTFLATFFHRRPQIIATHIILYYVRSY